MTLLDAPQFDEARERRNRLNLSISAGALLVLFVVWWLVAGRPVDWPWNWNAHLIGRSTINRFLTAVEKNDLPKAYGIWTHDPDWQQHPAQHGVYPYSLSLIHIFALSRDHLIECRRHRSRRRPMPQQHNVGARQRWPKPGARRSPYMHAVAGRQGQIGRRFDINRRAAVLHK